MVAITDESLELISQRTCFLIPQLIHPFGAFHEDCIAKYGIAM